MFNRVSAVVLFVQDFEKCLTFYRDALGLTVAMQEPKFAAFKMHEQNFAINEIAEAAKMVNVEVGKFEPQTGRVDRVMLCTQVDDVDAVYEAYKANGVEFTRPPIDQPWGVRAAYFTDPEGNIWEIGQWDQPEA